MRSRPVSSVLRTARQRLKLRLVVPSTVAVLAIAAAGSYAGAGTASRTVAQPAAKRPPAPTVMSLYNDTAKRWRYFLNAEGSGPQSALGGGGYEANEQRVETVCRQYQQATDPHAKQALQTALQASTTVLNKTVERTLVPYLNEFMVDLDKLGARLISHWKRGTGLGKQIDAAWKEATTGQRQWRSLLGEAKTATSQLSRGDCAGAHTTFFGIFNISGPYASNQVSDGMDTLKTFASKAR